jgi:hypothetical protein
MNRSRLFWMSTLLTVVVLSAGCGDTLETADAPRTSPTSAEEAAPPPEEGLRCQPVSAALLEAIASGLTVSGGGKLRNGFAVKSEDFSEVYFVSAEIDGPGMEGDGEVGTWATNSLEPGGGLILAVGGLAHEFSDWGHGEQTDAALSPDDDGVDESQECAGS